MINNPLTSELPESLANTRVEQGRIANYFVQVFGQYGHRTEAQNAVLAHIEKHAGEEGNSYRFHDAKDGIAIIASGIHRDGAKSVLKLINRQLELANKQQEPKPQPIIKR